MYILSWYSLSTILSIYNKTLMGKDYYNLNLPLLMSAVHSGIHSIITRILIKQYNHTIKKYSTFDYITKVVSLIANVHLYKLPLIFISRFHAV